MPIEIKIKNIEDLIGLHRTTCTLALETMQKKNHDYTNGNSDPFKNFRSAEKRGVDPRTGILLRVDDKLERLDTFIRHGNLKVTSESFDDAIEDVINYMILLKGLNIQMSESKPVTESRRQYCC